jgi:hypothetical protein
MRYSGARRAPHPARPRRITLCLTAAAALCAVLGPEAHPVDAGPARPAERHTAVPRPDTRPSPWSIRP